MKATANYIGFNTIMMICQFIVAEIRRTRTPQDTMSMFMDGLTDVAFFVAPAEDWFFAGMLVMIYSIDEMSIEDGLFIPRDPYCPQCLGLDRRCDWQTNFQCEPF